MADETVEIRAGDTVVFVDTLTDTATGSAISADLTDGTWTVACQVRARRAKTDPVLAQFTCEITGANTVKRSLYEAESLKLDDVPFPANDTAKKGKRTVYWDAEIRKTDGLAAGEDYVLTYESGVIKILGQVSRAV